MAVEPITLARPYAKAAFEYAKDQNALKGWSSMLHLASQIALDKQIAELVHNPRLSEDDILSVFFDVGNQVFNEPLRHLLLLLMTNDRLLYLPEIALLFEQYRAVYEQTLTVEITSAAPLNDAQKAQFKKRLQKRFGREVLLQYRIDEKLIGGAIIRAGDTVIDGSVLGKLNQLADNLHHVA